MYAPSQETLGVFSFVEPMDSGQVREFEIGISTPEDATKFAEFVLDYVMPHSITEGVDIESSELNDGVQLFDQQYKSRLVHIRKHWPADLVQTCELVVDASRLGEMSRRDGESRIAGQLMNLKRQRLKRCKKAIASANGD